MKAMIQQDLVVKSGAEGDCEPDRQNVDMEDMDTATAAQMEWDPQTDVASPMLSLQGIASLLGLYSLTASVYYYY